MDDAQATENSNVCKKPAAVSRSARAGTLFPIGRIHRTIKRNGRRKFVTSSAAAYSAAILECLTRELLDVAGNISIDLNANVITPRHLQLAVRGNEELATLIKNTIENTIVVAPRAQQTATVADTTATTATGNGSNDLNADVITPRHLQLAVRGDEEYATLIKNTIEDAIVVAPHAQQTVTAADTTATTATGNGSNDFNADVITPRHLQLVVRGNEELETLIKNTIEDAIVVEPHAQQTATAADTTATTATGNGSNDLNADVITARHLQLAVRGDEEYATLIKNTIEDAIVVAPHAQQTATAADTTATTATGNGSNDLNADVITPRHLQLAVRGNEELATLIKNTIEDAIVVAPHAQQTATAADTTATTATGNGSNDLNADVITPLHLQLAVRGNEELATLIKNTIEDAIVVAPHAEQTATAADTTATTATGNVSNDLNADVLAPRHLQLAVRGNEELETLIKNTIKDAIVVAPHAQQTATAADTTATTATTTVEQQGEPQSY